MATAVNAVLQYTEVSADFQIKPVPGYEDTMEKVLQRIYPTVDPGQAMRGFARGSELLQEVDSANKGSSTTRTQIYSLMSDYDTLVHDIFLNTIAETAQSKFEDHGLALRLLEHHDDGSVNMIVNRCIESANEIEEKAGSLQTNVNALKKKAIAVLTEASQQTELIEEIKSIFDNALVYLTQTENHCKHLSSMQMDTKKKIEQLTNEWRVLGYAYLRSVYYTQKENHCKHLSNMEMGIKNKIEQTANEWHALAHAHFAAKQALEAAKSGISQAM